MEQDKKLKELLRVGVLQKASPELANNIMQRIKTNNANNFIYAPLVPQKFVRIYRMVFLSVFGLLVLVSAIIKIAELTTNLHFKVPTFFVQHADTAIVYIIAFWTLLLLSKKLNAPGAYSHVDNQTHSHQ